MYEQQGYSTPDVALLMHVVHVERAVAVDVDVAREHRQFRVERGLGRAPVVPTAPALNKPAHVHKRGAVVPLGALELVREARQRELLLQQLEFVICDGDDEGTLRHGRGNVAGRKERRAGEYQTDDLQVLWAPDTFTSAGINTGSMASALLQ
jgi:hypothetical protein